MRYDDCMEKRNVVQEKSYSFALIVVSLYWRMQKELKEFVISKQLLRSGTSIGANIEEALQGRSKKDFIAKLSISLQEAHETRFWLRLIRDSVIPLDDEMQKILQKLLQNIEEIIAILTSIIKSTKDNLVE